MMLLLSIQPRNVSTRSCLGYLTILFRIATRCGVNPGAGSFWLALRVQADSVHSEKARNFGSTTLRLPSIYTLDGDHIPLFNGYKEGPGCQLQVGKLEAWGRNGSYCSGLRVGSGGMDPTMSSCVLSMHCCSSSHSPFLQRFTSTQKQRVQV